MVQNDGLTINFTDYYWYNEFNSHVFHQAETLADKTKLGKYLLKKKRLLESEFIDH